ncbi:hypothetical protein [Streptomyces avicenniae]|uniref:hypothetical protein n=1 Tax=Streptomyces avicenniae TaxID=500153 RepID=UPI00069AC772|nr:hypothetical protein [Streptomyces avicenniae]
MSLGNRALAALASDSARGPFLLALGHRLGIAAREIFADGSPGRLRRAQACNEMMIIIWTQARAPRGSGDGYPDRAFLTALLSKADGGEARPQLDHAVRAALAAVEPPPPPNGPDPGA